MSRVSVVVLVSRLVVWLALAAGFMPACTGWPGSRAPQLEGFDANSAGSTDVATSQDVAEDMLAGDVGVWMDAEGGALVPQGSTVELALPDSVTAIAGLTVVAPAGAVPQATSLTITDVSDQATRTVDGARPAVILDVQPNGMQFVQPVQFRFHLSAAFLAEHPATSALVADWDPKAQLWQPVTDQHLEDGGTVLTARLSHLSWKAILVASVEPNPKTASVQPSDQPPVLLLHGLFGSPNSWGQLDNLLTQRGVNVFVADYDSLAPIEKNACVLGDLIATILANPLIKKKYQTVTVVSHSMGGLIARAYVQGMGASGICASGWCDWFAPGAGKCPYAGNIARIVTLGTPHGGADLADWASVLLASASGLSVGNATSVLAQMALTTPSEMAQNSPFLTALNGQLPLALGPAPGYVALRGEFDKVVTGLHGALTAALALSPPQGLIDEAIVPGVSHTGSPLEGANTPGIAAVSSTQHPTWPFVCTALDLGNCCPSSGLVGQPCSVINGYGACAGVWSCAGTSDTCIGTAPSAEGCDGIDNDCDGLTDENLGTLTCGIGDCKHAVSACVAGQPGTCTPLPPSPEVCDGADNDCDGLTDESVNGWPDAPAPVFALTWNANKQLLLMAAGNELRHVASDGTGSGGPVTLNNTSKGVAGVDIAWNGTVYGVVWEIGQWESTMNHEVHFRTFDADLKPVSADLNLGSWLAAPSVAWNPVAGQFGVTWEDITCCTSPKPQGVYFAAFGNDGSTKVAPHYTGLPLGDLHIRWLNGPGRYMATQYKGGISVSLFKPDGVVDASLAEPAADLGGTVSVAVDASGWQAGIAASYGSGGPGGAVPFKFRLFNAKAMQFGPSMLLGTSEFGDGPSGVAFDGKAYGVLWASIAASGGATFAAIDAATTQMTVSPKVLPGLGDNSMPTPLAATPFGFIGAADSHRAVFFAPCP